VTIFEELRELFAKRRRDKLDKAKVLVKLDKIRTEFSETHPDVRVAEENPLADYFYLVKTARGFDIYFVKFDSFAIDRLEREFGHLRGAESPHVYADWINDANLRASYSRLKRE